MLRPLILALALVATPAFAQQPAPRPPVDVRLTDALRNDLAGTLIKMQQLGACDIACHLIIAKVLVALETAVPVEEKKADDPPK